MRKLLFALPVLLVSSLSLAESCDDWVAYHQIKSDVRIAPSPSPTNDAYKTFESPNKAYFVAVPLKKAANFQVKFEADGRVVNVVENKKTGFGFHFDQQGQCSAYYQFKPDPKNAFQMPLKIVMDLQACNKYVEILGRQGLSKIAIDSAAPNLPKPNASGRFPAHVTNTYLPTDSATIAKLDDLLEELSQSKMLNAAGRPFPPKSSRRPYDNTSSNMLFGLCGGSMKYESIAKMKPRIQELQRKNASSRKGSADRKAASEK